MFDVLAFPDRIVASPVAVRLAMPLTAGPNDEAEFVCAGMWSDHLRRHRPCVWHLVLHRGSGSSVWTHLYRVVPEHGGVLTLLHRALPGDCRVTLRRLAREIAGAGA